MLGERVARFLLERRRLTPGQLEEARRTQEFFGGQLESHLLKLGFVDEVSLGEALTDATGAPYASGEHLRVVPLEAIQAVPVAVVERHGVVPFEVSEGRLRLAMLNPRDGRALAEIQSVTGLDVDAWVTSEYRLYQALERHYRIRPKGVRAIALAPPIVRRDDEERVPERAEETPPDRPELGLDGKPIDAEWDFDEIYRPGGSATDDVRPERTEPAARGADLPKPPRDALGRLDEALPIAPNRDALAAALLEFCSTLAARSAIFAVGREDVRGVAGRGRGFERDRLVKLATPLHTSTIFDAALGSRDFYFGVVAPLPANRDLFTYLGGRIPANVLLVPIRVKTRTVALLYLDDDDRPMTRPDIPLMLRVAAKAGLAFEILLLRRKIEGI